ncbi:hypothetical protein BGW80DRAFT_1257649 [Lactifluus volemus]|nr:hypothetical protein BGW80DRAFT_1257649 [Lactifluus volemus]
MLAEPSRRANLANEINRAVASGITPPPSSLLQVPSDSEYQKTSCTSNSPEAMPSSASRAWLACAKPPSWTVGCGGVGSWVAVMLACSRIAPTLADVGMAKYVDPRVELWRVGADGAGLLQGADWIVVELLAHCVQSNIKVFSFMDAGTMLDPMRIDLSATHYDPLAHAVRQHLRAVFSRSQRFARLLRVRILNPSDDVTLLPLANSELATSAVDELAALRNFHVPIFKLPMLGPISALLDLNIATYVSRRLAGRPIDRPHGYDALGPPPDEGHEADLGLNPPQGYVDALGEPINPARFDNGIIISISEEVWGIEAARVTQARRFGFGCLRFSAHDNIPESA